MIANRQRRVRVSIPPLEEFLARVRRKLKIPAGSVSVCFVGDAEMSRWNSSYRGKRGSTDVLSFPASSDSRANVNGARRFSKRSPTSAARTHEKGNGNGNGKRNAEPAYLGDIAISPVVARRNAQRDGRTLSAELRILILHGVLHLLGYDHETDDGEMERYEHRLRAGLGLP
jgi:probable rRNA maturation factor